MNITYKTKPYKHQEETVKKHLDHNFFALFPEQGLGKTKIILDIIANNKGCKYVLVLAPNGLHQNWFYKELPEHFSQDYEAYCWKGMTTKKEVTAYDHFMNSQKAAKFLLMNVEAVLSKRVQDIIENFLQNNNTWIVIDESQCIKNYKAQRTKYLLKLKSDRKVILSGTPMPQGAIDMFSQCMFLSKSSIPYQNLTTFKSVFAQEELITMGNRSFKKIVGYKNSAHLSEIMAPFTTRLKKIDCLDLPEKIYETYYTDLSPEQERAYQEMKKLALTELKEGVASALQPIAKITKLHQICTGYLPKDDGTIHLFDNPRLSVLKAITEGTEESLVIFAKYKVNIEEIKKELGEDNCACFTGEEITSERTKAVQDFQNGNKRFFLATSAGARGITLTKASTMIYYSTDYNSETDLQSQDRIHRIGQKNTCRYIYLISPNTIEEKIMSILKDKENLSTFVLDKLISIIEKS